MSDGAYKESGVNRTRSEALIRDIAHAAQKTTRPEVLRAIGAFAGEFAVPRGYQNPVLVASTDGVGTKLMIAQDTGRHHNVGRDLVAMCVNDIAVSGAEPLFFLDYLATGELNLEATRSVALGIVEACAEAGCALLGGETAEMPGFYPTGRYDLAGFAVGIVERDRRITGERIQPGDQVVGLPSNGLHSNGYSLVRRILKENPILTMENDPCGLGCSLVEELLRPTRIYSKVLLDLHQRFDLRGAAHITGGGLIENIPRTLPHGVSVELRRSSWEPPPIFGLLKTLGDLTDEDYQRTFNLGIGMVLIVTTSEAAEVARAANGWIIGKVVKASDPPSVTLA